MKNVNLFQAIFAAVNSKRTDVRDDNDAEDYDAITIARGKMIDLYFEAVLDIDRDFVLEEATEENINKYVTEYYRFCENDAMQIFMK